jgi:exopolysaccharide biosynthesis polyprenyl glycosylphosphotransferase
MVVTSIDAGARRAAVDPSTRARRYAGSAAWQLFALDVVMFVGAAIAADAVEFRTLSAVSIVREFVGASWVFIALWVFLFWLVGLYRVSFAMTVRDEVYVVATALVLGIVPQLMLFTAVETLNSSRMALVLAALFGIVSVGGARALIHAWGDSAAAERARSVVVAGAAPLADLMVSSLELPAGSSIYEITLDSFDGTADVEAVLQRCARLGCSTLYLTFVPPESVFVRLTERALTLGIAVRIGLAAVSSGSFRLAVESTGSHLLLAPQPLRVRTIPARLYKRMFDLALAAPILVLAAPAFLFAALAIVIETGAPVFYRQRRVGLDGASFEMLKFRSMHVKHEHGQGWATRSDPRITRVGAILRRFSIDELPQFINVLRGEMSIVGPRPEIPSYVSQFEREIPRYSDRHLVKPGITGWSQIYMQRLLTPDDVRDVLRHDLFYVENWGVFMDLSIITKTAFEFLFHRPA